MKRILLTAFTLFTALTDGGCSGLLSADYGSHMEKTTIRPDTLPTLPKFDIEKLIFFTVPVGMPRNGAKCACGPSYEIDKLRTWLIQNYPTPHFLGPEDAEWLMDHDYLLPESWKEYEQIIFLSKKRDDSDYYLALRWVYPTHWLVRKADPIRNPQKTVVIGVR